MALKEKVLRGMLVLAACLCLGMPATAQSAVSLTVDDGWHKFHFQGRGSSWDREFSFTLPTPGILTVTDFQNAGDRFEVFSNGESLGLTSAPTGSSDLIWDYDLAASDPRWSTGVWNLAAGNYLISGLAYLSPYGSGNGVLRVDTAAAPPAPVPVPAAAWLLGSALAGCLGLRRFQRRDV